MFTSMFFQVTDRNQKSEGLESEYPLTRSLDVLDFFRSSGTEHDRVFRANEDFVLDAHAKAVKMFRELRVGRNVYA